MTNIRQKLRKTGRDSELDKRGTEGVKTERNMKKEKREIYKARWEKEMIK